MTDRMIENRVHALESLDARIKALEEQRERKRAELIAELEERGTDEIQTGNGCMVRNREIISDRFDTSSFKLAHSELYQLWIRKTVSHRFTYQA